MASDATGIDIYEAVINDLEAKIASLQMTVDNLKNVRGMTSALTAVSAIQPTTPRLNQTAEFGHDAFFGMTVADAARKYLSAIKKTATISSICDALIAGGWKTSAKNVTENVRTILSRTPDFVRISGEFGLAEWYPGRKTAVKRMPPLSPVVANAMQGFAEHLSDLATEQQQPSEQ